MSNLPSSSSSSPDSPQALREGEAGFWREIERMDKRQVAELLRHTQMERDRAVEERNALRASPSRDRAAVSLFQRGDFALHSGQSATWKIECDALTDADLDTLAAMLVERLPKFSQVEGVPRGGVRLASALRFHVSNKGPLLIVDDVATTGASLEQHRSGRDAIGAVLFARGACPSWVTPLFMLSPVAVSLSRTAEGKQEDDGLLGNTAAGKSSDPPSTSRRPSEDEINRLEKVAWDANVEHVLIWYRDRIEELEANRGN